MRSQQRKRRPYWILVCVLFITSLLFTGEWILSFGTQFYVSRILSKKTEGAFQYGSLRREGAQIILSNVHYQTKDLQIQAHTAYLSFHISAVPFFIEPHLFIDEFQIRIENMTENNTVFPFGLLSSMEWKVQVDRGAVSSPSLPKSPLYFTLDCREERGHFGVLSLYKEQQEEQRPFAEISLQMKKKQLEGKINVHDCPVAYFLPLCSLQSARWSKGWEAVEGKLNGHLDLTYSDNELDGVRCDLNVERMHLSNPTLGFGLNAKSLRTTLSYPLVSHEGKIEHPFWKNIDSFITIEEGSVSFKKGEEAWSLEHILGEVRLQPKTDPFLKMDGIAFSNGCKAPFSIEGKGEVLEEGTFWLQSEMKFFSGSDQTSIMASLCHHQHNRYLLEIEGKHITKKLSDLWQGIQSKTCPNLCIQKGILDIHVTAHLEGIYPKRIEVSECEARDCVWSISSGFKGRCRLLSATGVVEKTMNEWKLERLHCEVSEGYMQTMALASPIENIQAKVDIVDHCLLPSYIEGRYHGINSNIHVMDMTSPYLYHVESYGPLKEWISLLPNLSDIQIRSDTNVSVACDVASLENSASCDGVVRISENGEEGSDIEFHAALAHTISHKISDLMSSWDFSSLRGSFQSERITNTLWSPWLLSVDTDLQGKGSVRVNGSFDPKVWKIRIPAYEIQLSHPSFGAQLKCVGEGAIEISYEKDTAKWKGTVPSSDAQIVLSKYGYHLELLPTIFIFEQDKIWTDRWQARIQNVVLQGSLYHDAQGLQIISNQMSGRIESYLSLLQPMIVVSEGIKEIKGELLFPEGGCRLEVKKEKGGFSYEWQMEGLCRDLSYPLASWGVLRDGHFTWAYHSSGGFSLKNIQAICALKQTECTLKASDFSWAQGQSTPFWVLLEEKDKELLRLEGTYNSLSSLSFSKATHCMGMPLEIEPISLESQKIQFPISIHTVLRADRIPLYMQTAEKIGLFQNSLFHHEFGPLRGSVDMRFQLEKQGVGIEAKSQDLSYNGQSLAPAYGKIQSCGNHWKIESCTVGPYKGEAAFQIQQNLCAISSFYLASPQMRCTAKAWEIGLEDKHISLPAFQMVLQIKDPLVAAQMQLAGSFYGTLQEGSPVGKGAIRGLVDFTIPSAFQVIQKKEVGFQLDRKEGIKTLPLQFDVLGASDQKIGTLSTGQIQLQFPGNRFFAQNVRLSCNKKGMELIQKSPKLPVGIVSLLQAKELDLQAEIDFSPTYKKVSGNLQEGICSFSSRSLEYKHLQFLFEQDQLYLSCKAKWEKEPLNVQASISFKDKPFVNVVCKEHPDSPGITAQFLPNREGSFICEKIQGTCKGIAVDVKRKESLIKDTSQYVGSIGLDFSEASSLFPSDLEKKVKKWQLGKGYQCRGIFSWKDHDLNSFSFSGDVLGTSFVFLGKSWELLQAKVELSSQGGMIQDCKVEDCAGTFLAKQIKLERNNQDRSFWITIPIFQAKDFIPMKLHPDKKNKEGGATIRNLSIYDVKGSLGDLTSFEGNGSLNFASLSKKEFSFWDIPFAMIKDLGLDPGLLTPTSGEVDFHIWQGKCCLTDLRNAYSDEKRSQFFLALPGEDCYLDLEGNWHIDLRMKQNVVWKLTEDYILSVRGNLEKPKYSLKKGDKE